MQRRRLVQLLEHPDGDGSACALIHGDRHLSYDELGEQSAGFARAFSDIGLKPHGTVVILLKKSVEYVVSMFAALTCRAAYVPLDYDTPVERLRYIVGNCAAAVLVTDSEKAVTLGTTFPGVSVLLAEEMSRSLENSGWALPPPAACAPASAPEDLAYIIYTSGSTGVPKGVMVSQRNVVSFLTSLRALGLYDSSTRFLNVCPLHFDASVLDVFGTLDAGGCVVLMDKFLWPRQVLNAIEKFEITDTLIVPSVLNMIAAHAGESAGAKMKTLRSLWFGGEQSSVQTVRQLMLSLPGVTFVHGYGPTETTHSATVKVLDGPPSGESETISIGRPLPTVDLYVLDDDGAPVADDVPGELCIGGAQLMAGYCGDPERTAEVLVTNPVTGQGRVYRSGDIVRRDACGDYYFISRKDDMVKVGGNLVYLSEIEAAIGNLPDVQHVCVFHVSTGAGHRLLAVAVVSDDAPTVPEVRRAVLERLPSYMVPDVVHIVRSDRSFVTPAGKIDRSKLLESALERLQW